MRGCRGCRDERALPIAFTMAFQAIIDLRDRTVRGYEALVRGLRGESTVEAMSRTVWRLPQAWRETLPRSP